jgi:hypothetical protein
MNPADLLATLAQLGVALAGFSGIVVVLGARASGEWSTRERQLLSALLATSGGVILWSLLPLLLLAAGLADPSVWLLSSASWFVTQLAILFIRARQFARDPGAEGWERRFLILAFVGGVTVLVLQLVNLWLRASWPHLTAVTWHLMLSFLVFVRLLLAPAR